MSRSSCSCDSGCGCNNGCACNGNCGCGRGCGCGCSGCFGCCDYSCVLSSIYNVYTLQYLASILYCFLGNGMNCCPTGNCGGNV